MSLRAVCDAAQLSDTLLVLVMPFCECVCREWSECIPTWLLLSEILTNLLPCVMSVCHN